MQKNHSPKHSLYWYILSEDEWYGKNTTTRQTITEECLAEAKERGAKYANIMVNPDPVMSISPEPRTHHVWKWSAERDASLDRVETLDYWKQRALTAEKALKDLGYEP